MQERGRETPAAIPAPVDRECSEVLGAGFEAKLEPRNGIQAGLSSRVEGKRAYAAAWSGSRARCLARVRAFTRSAKPRRSVSWAVCPTLCARRR